MKFCLLPIAFFLALLTSSCSPVVENENKSSKNMSEIYNVLHQVFNNNSLSIHLEPNIEQKKILLYRFEELPIHNSVYLPKPSPKEAQPIAYIKKNVEIKYNLNMKDEIDNLVIIVEQIIVEGNNATIKIRIPKQAIFGSFKLYKKENWVITSAEVFQT